jgi:putative aldouronate transport system permease protein
MVGIRETKQDKIVRWVSMFFITFLAIACLYPYLNVVAKSFSGADVVNAGKVNGIFPKNFSTESYGLVFRSSRFFSSFRNTVFVTIVGNVLNLAFTIFVAYAVSRKDLPGGRIIMLLYIITMLFSGGLIPTYVVVIGAGMRNSLWSLIIPTLVVPFNLVLMRNFFATIPYSLEESAMMDGAGHFTVLFKIIVPLAMPSIATIALFCAVSQWNTYFNALMYIDDRSKAILQIYLRELMMSVQDAERNGVIDELSMNTATQSMQGAAVFASTLPIIIVYPFLQRYFVKGMTLGAVKE